MLRDSSTQFGREFGPYRIRAVLGRGASSIVYLGRRSDGVDVAVKVLTAFAMGDAGFRRAIPREFDALRRVDHPGVIRAHRTGTIADVHFIELEWIDGPTVSAALTSGKPLDLVRAVSIGARVARALQHCHDHGVVHRDVKPSNILLRSDDDPVLFDFGLAQAGESPDAEPGRLYATSMTASPEQIRARGPVDGRADVYALGITLFRLATGSLPFVGDRMDMLRLHSEVEPPDPQAISKAVPDDFAALILRSIEKDPNQRFGSAEDMAVALDGLDHAELEPRSRWRRS
ncbi:MAG: serine/threonine-protein kinase [Acidimicrobiales bacterium]